MIDKKYLPKVVGWMKKISKVELEGQEEFLKKLIFLRNRLDRILGHVRNLGISWDKLRAQIPLIIQDSDSEEEFLKIAENSNQVLKSDDFKRNELVTSNDSSLEKCKSSEDSDSDVKRNVKQKTHSEKECKFLTLVLTIVSIIGKSADCTIWGRPGLLGQN